MAWTSRDDRTAHARDRRQPCTVRLLHCNAYIARVISTSTAFFFFNNKDGFVWPRFEISQKTRRTLPADACLPRTIVGYCRRWQEKPYEIRRFPKSYSTRVTRVPRQQRSSAAFLICRHFIYNLHVFSLPSKKKKGIIVIANVIWVD